VFHIPNKKLIWTPSPGIKAKAMYLIVLKIAQFIISVNIYQLFRMTRRASPSEVRVRSHAHISTTKGMYTRVKIEPQRNSLDKFTDYLAKEKQVANRWQSLPPEYLFCYWQ